MSRCIVITSYTIYLRKLNELEKEIKIDVQKETISTIKRILLSPNLDQSIFDIALEGISYLWLQDPDILSDIDECKDVFEIVFERFKHKSLKS